MSEFITIKKPYVLHGPKGVDEDVATAQYLDEVRRKIENGHIVVGGYNVSSAVIDLLISVSYVLRGGHPEERVRERVADEIAAEACDTGDGYGVDAYLNGLRRAEEIARSGR